VLVPEAAEILAAIGYGGEVRAVLGPEALRRVLATCHPDLVFTSETAEGGGVTRREARRIVAACQPKPSVYALEPHSLGDILSDVKTVGDAVGRPGAARVVIELLRARVDAVSLRAAEAVARTRPRRVACLVTRDPPVAAGWWQAELVGLAGGLDVFDGVGRPPRPLTWAEIERAEPELVVWLADEPVAARYQPSAGAGQAPPDAAAWRGLIRLAGAQPGPGAVAVLERLAALLLPSNVASAR
jgi:iron complex transport system substrate-binding protein